jgi:hypothetical protein
VTTSRSLILKPSEHSDALSTKIERVIKPWFKRFDLFPLHEGSDADEETGVTTAIWLDAARPDFELRLVADDQAEMLYLVVVPDEGADAAALIADLRAHFETYRPDELLADVEADPGDVAAWTRLAVAMNGEHDPRVESLLLANLSGSDSAGLHSAAVGAALLCWSSLAGPLRDALSRPIPEDARGPLALALQASMANADVS